MTRLEMWKYAVKIALLGSLISCVVATAATTALDAILPVVTR